MLQSPVWTSSTNGSERRMNRIVKPLARLAVVGAIAVTVAITSGYVAEAGGSDQRPFKGSTDGISVFHPFTNNARCAELGLPGVPVCVELIGESRATHLGKAQFQAVFFPGPPIANLGDCSSQVGVGKAKWTAADGSELQMDVVANENCVIEDGSPDTWSVASQFIVIGGTGRFENEPTGTIDVEGVAIPGVGFEVELEGFIGY